MRAFGELRSVLHAPTITRQRWQALLADEALALDDLSEDYLRAVRELQQRRASWHPFSPLLRDVADTLEREEHEPTMAAPRARNALCAHLDLSPALRLAMRSPTRRLDLERLLTRGGFHDLRHLSLSTTFDPFQTPATFARFLSHTALARLERLDVWGAVPRPDTPSADVGGNGVLLALLDSPPLTHLTTLSLRQCGVDASSLAALTRCAWWSRIEALDLSYNPLGIHGISLLATHRPARLRELHLHGVTGIHPALASEVLRANPELLAIAGVTTHDERSPREVPRCFDTHGDTQLGIWLFGDQDRGSQHWVHEADALYMGRASRSGAPEAASDFMTLRSPHIARRHARLLRYEQELYLEDLSSTNGTSHDTEPVRGQVIRYRDGATIELAGVVRLRISRLS